MSRAKLDLCLSKIAIAALFVRTAFAARLRAAVTLFSATSLRLTFVDPVHSRWLSRPGKFRAMCSPQDREEDRGKARREFESKASSKFLRAGKLIFRRNNPSVSSTRRLEATCENKCSYFKRLIAIGKQHIERFSAIRICTGWCNAILIEFKCQLIQNKSFTLISIAVFESVCFFCVLPIWLNIILFTTS